MADAGGWRLRAVHEWCAHDPFGKVKPADSAIAPDLADVSGMVRLRAPLAGYASFRLLVYGGGEYMLRGRLGGGIEMDVYKAWYHRMAGGNAPLCLPDALVPVRQGQRFALPDADNNIPGQTVQEFWVDLYAPPDAPAASVSGEVLLEAAGHKISLPLTVEVIAAAVPDETCIVMDHNSYGARWLYSMYGAAFSRARPPAKMWGKTIELLHHYHRLVHEHRGSFHNLGYEHSGAVDPIYAPGVAGSGRGRRLEGWELFDRHYGPLLDGSAFRKPAPALPRPRRPAAPVWGTYTPINPDWPASYLWWGEKGYEAEFVACLRQFDGHLRDNGWTRTRIEFFFNHKKRYRWFEWDGDEPKYAKDDAYHVEMGRLLRAATAGSPANWVYRMDASWQMQQQFERLAGVVNFWVLGGFSRWFPEEIRRARERGDIVWWYGGTPAMNAASSAILENVYKTWARGFAGYCAWLTVSPGPDPWFACDGAATGSIYPGERFGIHGPIPSIRLKIQRNGIQDVDLISRHPETADAARRELAGHIPLALWEEPPLAVRELPPEDWDNHNLTAHIEPGTQPPARLPADWWLPIRQRALAGARERQAGR